MNDKEIAMQTIDKLPKDSNIDDIMHALYITAKFEHGANEIRDGKGISQHFWKTSENLSTKYFILYI